MIGLQLLSLKLLTGLIPFWSKRWLVYYAG
jgi:hypothetical protein